MSGSGGGNWRKLGKIFRGGRWGPGTNVRRGIGSIDYSRRRSSGLGGNWSLGFLFCSLLPPCPTLMRLEAAPGLRAGRRVAAAAVAAAPDAGQGKGEGFHIGGHGIPSADAEQRRSPPTRSPATARGGRGLSRWERSPPTRPNGRPPTARAGDCRCCCARSARVRHQFTSHSRTAQCSSSDRPVD